VNLLLLVLLMASVICFLVIKLIKTFEEKNDAVYAAKVLANRLDSLFWLYDNEGQFKNGNVDGAFDEGQVRADEFLDAVSKTLYLERVQKVIKNQKLYCQPPRKAG